MTRWLLNISKDWDSTTIQTSALEYLSVTKKRINDCHFWGPPKWEPFHLNGSLLEVSSKMSTEKLKLTSFSFLKLIPMEDSGNELQPNSLLAIKSGLNIRLDIKCSTCLIYARNSPSPIVLKILLCINYFVLFKYK